MTTIINTPGNPVSTESADSGAGWFVAVIILLVVIGVGAYLWFHYYTPPATSGTTNINVTIPATPSQGNTPATQ